MNGNKLVLDTNIVLYLLNGDSELLKILTDKKLFVSIITEIELLGYKDLSTDEKIKISYFLSECKIIPIDNDIKDICIQIKQKCKIKTPDAIVAATSVYLQIPLITSDKGFEKLEDLILFLYQI